MRHATLKPPKHKHFEGVMGERETLSWMSRASVRLWAGTLGRQVPSRTSMAHSVTMTSPKKYLHQRKRIPCSQQPAHCSVPCGSQRSTGCGRCHQLCQIPFMGKPWVLNSRKPHGRPDITRCFLGVPEDVSPHHGAMFAPRV